MSAYQQYERLHRTMMNTYKQGIANILRDQVNAFIDHFRNDPAADASAAELPVRSLARAMARIHTAAGSTMAKVTNRTLNRTIRKSANGDLQRWQYVILLYLKEHNLELVGMITATTRRQINAALSRAAAEGLSHYDTIKLLEGLPLNGRAENIVRTETTKSANIGSMVGALDTGILTNKQWISAQDNRTRRIPRDNYDHLHMHDVTVAFDAAFVVPSLKTVDALQFPGDPAGSEGNVCNCRCTMAFVPVRTETGQLVPLSNMPPQGKIDRILRQVAGVEITTILINQLINELVYATE